MQQCKKDWNSVCKDRCSFSTNLFIWLHHLLYLQCKYVFFKIFICCIQTSDDTSAYRCKDKHTPSLGFFFNWSERCKFKQTESWEALLLLFQEETHNVSLMQTNEKNWPCKPVPFLRRALSKQAIQTSNLTFQHVYRVFRWERCWAAESQRTGVSSVTRRFEF